MTSINNMHIIRALIKFPLPIYKDLKMTSNTAHFLIWLVKEMDIDWEMDG